MKKSTSQWMVVLFAAMTLFSCKDAAVTSNEEVTTDDAKVAYSAISNEDLETAVIYKANVTEYSEAGTFNEFTKGIPKLKKLGVKVIWLMPVFSVSEKNGNPYAVNSYEKVNPDLGTDEDLDLLIQTAHDNGMFIILDWPSSSTGLDHTWMKKYPDFYANSNKGLKNTATLNYENRELWDAMASAMIYWVEARNVDGFRCDVAHEVPVQFWNYASKSVNDVKQVLMLAESERKELFVDAFDMGYNIEGHAIMNELATGNVTVNTWDEYMLRVNENYQEDDILMNFVINHDQNSLNQNRTERMEEASEAMLALQYVIPGMPLIYSDQGYGMIEEVDDTQKFKEWNVMEKLGTLKATNPALNGGKNAASYKRINTSEDSKIYAIEREKDGHKVIYVANFSSKLVEFKAPTVAGEMTDAVRGSVSNIPANYNFTFPPNGYRVWVVKN